MNSNCENAQYYIYGKNIENALFIHYTTIYHDYIINFYLPESVSIDTAVNIRLKLLNRCYLNIPKIDNDKM